MKIKVTWEDIKNGTHVSTSCPVALALNRATNEHWVVTDHGFWIDGERYFGKIWSSPEVDKFVQDYDHNYFDGKKIKPFEFSIFIEDLNE